LKKIFLNLLAFLCLVFPGVSMAFPRTPVPKAENRINVLLITIDTLRPGRLSCYGSRDPQTPHIDELARRGVLFSRAFSNAATTLPSHADILLGVTPNYHGVHENLNFVVSDDLLTLAEYLKGFGYATGAFIGAYPLDARFGLSHGFDDYDDHYGRTHTENYASLERRAEDVTRSALEWLEGRRSPWFLWIHCWDPHLPYAPPEPFMTRYKGHLYDGEVAYVDAALAKIIDHLKENNLFDSTLVIFTGDHGESLGEHGEKTHGFFAYNSTIWIPLLISSPGTTPGRTGDYVSHIDIFPTVCDLLDIEKPSFLQGRSLLPALKGTALEERPIYFESLYPFYSRGWAPLRGFILNKKKFIDSPIPELYDLNNDFAELNNLAKPDVTGELTARLNKMIENLTPSRKVDAVRAADQRTREKLASLGYVSTIQVSKKRTYGVQDDIKTLLPYLNRAADAREMSLEGKQEEATRLLKQVIRERSNIDLAYENLASIYQHEGHLDEALAILEQGLAALPTSHELLIDYMKMLISGRQYDKVISAFEKRSLRESDYDPALWNNLGVAYAGKGRYAEAIKAYERGLSLDKKLPELNNNLANAYFSLDLESGDSVLFGRCLEFYKKAIELDPEYSAPYHGLGQAYLEEGDKKAAMTCWEKALEAHPDFSPALFDLAAAYIEEGDKAKAYRLLSEFEKKYAAFLRPDDRAKLAALLEKSRREPGYAAHNPSPASR